MGISSFFLHLIRTMLWEFTAFFYTSHEPCWLVGYRVQTQVEYLSRLDHPKRK